MINPNDELSKVEDQADHMQLPFKVRCMYLFLNHTHTHTHKQYYPKGSSLAHCLSSRVTLRLRSPSNCKIIVKI